MSLYTYEDRDESSIVFYSDGTLCAAAYSYEISSFGTIELSKEETRKLYETMKTYYETIGE